jgi:hypothetical protein
VSNSGTLASNRQNTASPKYNDGISLLIQYLISAVQIMFVQYYTDDSTDRVFKNIISGLSSLVPTCGTKNVQSCVSAYSTNVKYGQRTENRRQIKTNLILKNMIVYDIIC